MAIMDSALIGQWVKAPFYGDTGEPVEDWAAHDCCRDVRWEWVRVLHETIGGGYLCMTQEDGSNLRIFSHRVLWVEDTDKTLDFLRDRDKRRREPV